MVEKKGIILVEMFQVLFLELKFFQRNIWYRLGVGLEQEERAGNLWKSATIEGRAKHSGSENLGLDTTSM